MSKRNSKSNSSSKRKAGHFFSRKDDAIQWFQREGFDPAEFITLLQSEKELDQARNELTQLNEYCKEEVQKVVHAHHKDFLEASRNLQDVEILVDELRNYVSGSVAVVGNLVDLPPLPKQVSFSSPLAAEGPTGAPKPPTAWESILALQAELMQDLQVAVAEHDVALARALLSAGRDLIAVVDRDGAQLAAQVNGDGLPAWRHAFESALAAQKVILVEELQRKLSHTNSSTLERRQAAQNLGLVVGPGQATQALLGCHSLRVRAAQQHLLKQHSAAGGDPDGVEYAGGLSQRTFLAIGAAAEDVRAVFPSTSTGGHGYSDRPRLGAADGGAQAAAVLPQVSALVVQWASDEARHCASLLCRHALTPFVATGMAVGALLCVGLALVFCVALESSHGLALRVAFMEELWPLVEAIVRRHLHRLREEASASASVDATNAALQAIASNGSAYASSAASGISAALPVYSGANGLATAPNPYPGESGAVQGSLPDLFPRSGAPQAPAVPAGLTCLPMLIPELRALAEGLASLGSRSAVAMLRQGVQAIFESVCEKVHASLTRLVGSSTGAATGGIKESASQGSLLAAYVAKAERQLRLFAECDVQVALVPLSCVCGPVAPPDLLVPLLAPLGELLTKLPEPAPDAAPVDPNPSGQPALQPQSSGLLDRIRAELEAEQGQRRRERDGWRSKNALGQAAGAVAALSAGGTPLAAADPAAALDAQPSDAPSSSRVASAQAVREPKLPVKAAAPAREAVRQQAEDEGGGEAAAKSRQRQQHLDAHSMAKRPEADNSAAAGTVVQVAETTARRRPGPQPDLEPEPQSQREQRRGILRTADIPQQPEDVFVDEHPEPVHARRRRKPALEPAPSTDPASGGEDETAAAPSARSRSRERGRLGGKGSTAVESSDSLDGWDASGRRQRELPPRSGAGARPELTEGTISAGARQEQQQQQQQPSGRSQARKGWLEAEAAGELPGNARADTTTAARDRRGRDHFVRFEEPPKPGPTPDSARGSGSDEKVHVRRPPRDREAARDSSRAAMQGAEGLENAGDESPPPVLPGRRLRQDVAQRRHAAQQEEVQPPVDSQYKEASAGLGRAAGRGRGGTGDTEVKGESGVLEGTLRLPVLDDEEEELSQPRRARPRWHHGDGEEPVDASAGEMVPRKHGHATGQPASKRTELTDGAEAMAGTRAVVSGAAAAPARPCDDLPDDGTKPLAGGVGRRANRFCVVLSDDEDDPIPAPRLRRPRAAAAGAATAASAAADVGGPELQQSRRAVGSRDLAAADVTSAAGQMDAGRSDRRERSGVPEGRSGGMAEAQPPLTSRRRVKSEPDVDEQQGERRTSGKDATPTDLQPPAGGRPLSLSASGNAKNEAAGGKDTAADTTTVAVSRPQTARERLAARMAAKAAAAEGLL
ncbi:hypothetical protein PLESTB_000847700 [Pleodorina starrii]|uniref:Conserved oligomeric Golgi complex subunit 2 n=1 Tax=Pleodorina starrii TaxID=330485 RepID=A0A9W6BLI1_9CHLO|nr:hypothetical protein PLESTB_000847700 [Pleodorina starrii]